ncbi:hypothetical protein B0J11DRAFT_617681 [Dendryphion nanum]|uniref:Uncharacterized protein n=1 Tax=Dendryphion nanum TaxID=256645 RepID=A0A9P9DF58_9PLEO|nr:hypothetical protein B0J11DRAFT_617681 [Dendryphion nanum]
MGNNCSHPAPLIEIQGPRSSIFVASGFSFRPPHPPHPSRPPPPFPPFPPRHHGGKCQSPSPPSDFSSDSGTIELPRRRSKARKRGVARLRRSPRPKPETVEGSEIGDTPGMMHPRVYAGRVPGIRGGGRGAPMYPVDRPGNDLDSEIGYSAMLPRMGGDMPGMGSMGGYGPYGDRACGMSMDMPQMEPGVPAGMGMGYGGKLMMPPPYTAQPPMYGQAPPGYGFSPHLQYGANIGGMAVPPAMPVGMAMAPVQPNHVPVVPQHPVPLPGNMTRIPSGAFTQGVTERSNGEPVPTKQKPNARSRRVVAADSGHEWIQGDPFLDACMCTTTCTCRQGHRVLYREQNDDGERMSGEIRYILKNQIGRDCGDHSSCTKAETEKARAEIETMAARKEAQDGMRRMAEGMQDIVNRLEKLDVKQNNASPPLPSVLPNLAGGQPTAPLPARPPIPGMFPGVAPGMQNPYAQAFPMNSQMANQINSHQAQMNMGNMGNMGAMGANLPQSMEQGITPGMAQAMAAGMIQGMTPGMAQGMTGFQPNLHRPLDSQQMNPTILNHMNMGGGFGDAESSPGDTFGMEMEMPWRPPPRREKIGPDMRIYRNRRKGRGGGGRPSPQEFLMREYHDKAGRGPMGSGGYPLTGRPEIRRPRPPEFPDEEAMPQMQGTYPGPRYGSDVGGGSSQAWEDFNPEWREGEEAVSPRSRGIPPAGFRGRGGGDLRGLGKQARVEDGNETSIN